MTAHFYAWEPSLAIDPRSAGFEQQLEQAQASTADPTVSLLKFVERLLAKYPELSQSDDTPWATGPLAGEITGAFINFAVSWSWYNRALIDFVATTAGSCGLHCYDPQDGRFYQSAP
jgi:hypothetical protein